MIPRPAVLLLLALAGAAALSACGRQAQLARPGPLVQPTGDEALRQDAARRALQDAASRSDPRAPGSYAELRNLDSLKRNKRRLGALDPSAPRPPGSPPEEAVPPSSAPAASGP